MCYLSFASRVTRAGGAPAAARQCVRGPAATLSASLDSFGSSGSAGCLEPGSDAELSRLGGVSPLSTEAQEKSELRVMVVFHSLPNFQGGSGQSFKGCPGRNKPLAPSTNATCGEFRVFFATCCGWLRLGLTQFCQSPTKGKCPLFWLPKTNKQNKRDAQNKRKKNLGPKRTRGIAGRQAYGLLPEAAPQVPAGSQAPCRDPLVGWCRDTSVTGAGECA